MTTTIARTKKRVTKLLNSTTSATGDPLPTAEVRFGVVKAYSVDADRLMIKFTVVPFFAGPETDRILISVGADEPHFRSAVSMVMMVYHKDQGPKYLTVRYRPPLSIPGFPQPSPEIFQLLELGFGTDPVSALSFEDWPT